MMKKCPVLASLTGVVQGLPKVWNFSLSVGKYRQRGRQAHGLKGTVTKHQERINVLFILCGAILLELMSEIVYWRPSVRLNLV